ncbi:MAG: hypothetical protein ABJ059_05910 [Hyphomicrobiales bacterium]
MTRRGVTPGVPLVVVPKVSTFGPAALLLCCAPTAAVAAAAVAAALLLPLLLLLLLLLWCVMTRVKSRRIALWMQLMMICQECSAHDGA